MKKIFTTIALSFLAVALIPALFLVSCSDKDNISLSIGADDYTIVTGRDTGIEIASGNGDYSVYSEDETIVLAGYSRTGKKSAGNLILTGLEAGETWVTVIDNVSFEEKRIKVSVENENPEQPE